MNSAVNDDNANSMENNLKVQLREKVQLNFGLLPSFVRAEFERLAELNQMTKREYFFHLLRENGAKIPPYSMMDLRKL